LLLTIVNTILLGGYVLGPALNGFGKRQWAEYQSRRAERRAAAAIAAARPAAMSVERRCLDYAQPPGTLVYDDDPGRQGLSEAATTAERAGPTTRTAQAPAAAWPAIVAQPDAYRALPTHVDGWGRLVNPTYTVLFMHERRASGGSERRLVLVVASPESLLSPPDAEKHGEREFIAITLQPTTPAGDLKATAWASFKWRPAPAPKAARVDAARGAAGTDVTAAGSSLRLFAGEADAVDASKLVLPFELGGTRGSIVGRLQADDRVQLTPDGALRAGWKAGGSRGVIQ
jgi:hypothetical protein